MIILSHPNPGLWKISYCLGPLKKICPLLFWPQTSKSTPLTSLCFVEMEPICSFLTESDGSLPLPWLLGTLSYSCLWFNIHPASVAQVAATKPLGILSTHLNSLCFYHILRPVLTYDSKEDMILVFILSPSRDPQLTELLDKYLLSICGIPHLVPGTRTLLIYWR